MTWAVDDDWEVQGVNVRTSTARRVIAAVASVMAGLALTAAVPLAAHATPLGASFGGSQVAATGRVVDSAGRPVAARVLLYAWPTDWPGKRRLSRGEIVPLRLVGQAESRASGGFVLRVSSQSALQASVGPSGIVNLELFAASAAGSGSFSFPRRVVSAGG